MSKFDRFQPPPWPEAKTAKEIESALEEHNRRLYERFLEEEYERKSALKDRPQAETTANTTQEVT